MSDSYTEKLADLSDKSDDDLKTLETDFVKDFDKADEADDLDSLAASADAIDAVRAEQERREKEAAKAKKSDDKSSDEAKSEERPAPKKEPVAAAAAEPEPDPDKGDAEEGDEDGDAEVEGEANKTETKTETETETKTDEVKVEDKSEPVTASGQPDDNPPEADESADADAADEGGVQASGKQQGQEDSQVDIPEDRKPVATASPATTVVAGADIPGFGAGTEFNNLAEVNDAFLARLNSVKRARGGDGEQHVVASVKADIPEDRMLAPGDIEGNSRKIEAVTGLPAIVAAGGFCAPLAVRYDIFGLGSTVRPIKNSLPGFGATRGGIRFVAPPKLGDDAAAVGLWSATEDSSASGIATVTNKALTSNVVTLTTGAVHGYVVGQSVKVSGVGAPFDGTYVVASVPDTTSFTYAKVAANVTSAAAAGASQQIKPTLRVACAAELTATVDAITLSLIFGNLMSRAFPELVARHNDLALVQQARFAEINLLNQLSAASTAVTSAFKIGTARDFLLAVGKAAAAYRNRHRVARDTPLRVIAPEWVLDAMREDLTQGLPGDKLTAADAEINKYFADRAVNVTWHMDDAIATQGTGAIVDFPATFKWFIFAEGTFLLLDGGTLDLGIVRDSGLVGTNDYMVFVEIFEALAKVGIESVAVTTTSHVSGSVVGTTSPA